MRRLIWDERMNPLGIAPERFTVAEGNAGRLLGFGQLEQKDGYLELRSMVVDPSARCGSAHACMLACSMEVTCLHVSPCMRP
jgi:N-acetylglutamate synthase-like GNAT family acetyltransferase